MTAALIAWLLILFSSLCACSQPELQRYDSEFLAMGTRVQLSLLTTSPALAATCSAEVERALLRQGIDWYAFTTRNDGELKQLNDALSSGQSMTVSAELLPLLQAALQAYQHSDGYFDPGVELLVDAWGFARLEQSPRTPAASLLEHWRIDHPTLAALQIEGQQVSSTRRDLQLDLGAIAKGYALQRAGARLRQQGCNNAALNLGGQLAIMGEAMAAQYGAVRIRSPRSDTPLAELQLGAGESISTSGDYERFSLRDGQRQHHLLDPHTGQPVAHTQAVTVVSDDATLADAASTALMAAGPQHWQRIARQMGVRDVLRIDASGAIEVSAALYARLHWLNHLSTDQIKIIEP